MPLPARVPLGDKTRVNEATQMIAAISQGDPRAAGELLPLVYDELRKLAASRMAREQAGQTLQATALVHEAWLRLIGTDNPQFDGRGHFFAAAGEAMRRILVEQARRKLSLKRGAGVERVALDFAEVAITGGDDDKLLQVHEALDELAATEPLQADVVKLRFFVGMSNEEAALALGINEKTVRRRWNHAKLWLYEKIQFGA